MLARLLHAVLLIVTISSITICVNYLPITALVLATVLARLLLVHLFNSSLHAIAHSHSMAMDVLKLDVLN